jgi:hypothetical protein
MGYGMLKRLILPLAGLALALAGQPGLAQVAAPAGKLTIEINKFEEIEGGGCRAFFLFDNATGKSFEGFEMSLAIFNADGVIDRLLSIDAAPLPVARTTLKLFEVPQIACASISQVLLHDVPVCKPQNEENTDCYPMLDLRSRTSAPLED